MSLGLLDYNDNLYQTPKGLEQIAQLCNEKKMNAKTCSERSGELYLAFLIKVSGEISGALFVFFRCLDKEKNDFLCVNSA